MGRSPLHKQMEQKLNCLTKIRQYSTMNDCYIAYNTLKYDVEMNYDIAEQ